MQRSSPAASSGFSRFDASTVPPCAAPAPRMVWISSMKRIGRLRWVMACTSALKRASKSPRYLRARQQRPDVEGEDLGVAQIVGHLPAVDLDGEPFGDGGLAHARLAHEDRVVLAPPRQDVNGARQLGLASDQRIELAAGGALGEVGGERCQRICRHLAFLGLGRAARRRGAAADLLGSRLGDAVRHEPQQIEARDALGAQQRDRVGVGLLQDGRQQITRVRFLLLGALHVMERMLHHAMEGEGLALLERPVAGLALQVLLEEALELALQGLHVGAAGAQAFDAAGLVEQRIEQVLDGDVRMAVRGGLVQGRLQGHLELARQSAHSGSAPARSG